MSNVTRRKRRTTFALAVLCGLPTAILVGGGPALADSGEEDVKKVRVVREVGKVPGEANGEAVVVWVEEKVEGGELTEMHVSGSTSFTIDANRGYLGLRYLPLNGELLDHFGIPHDRGALVSIVEPASPADTAGLLVGDVVTAIDGLPLDSDSALRREIVSRDEGTEVELEVWRDGRARTLAPVVAARQRTQLNVGELMLRSTDGEQPVLFSGFDPVVIGRAQKRLNEFVADPTFVTRVAGACGDREEMQERLVEMEARLREMESRLREALAASE